MEGYESPTLWDDDDEEEEESRWSSFDQEQRFIGGKRLGEDYHEVTIVEKGGDLQDGEITDSALPLPPTYRGEVDEDEDYEYNDDDMPYTPIGFCSNCGDRLDEHKYCLACGKDQRYGGTQVVRGLKCDCGCEEFDQDDVCLACGEQPGPQRLLGSS